MSIGVIPDEGIYLSGKHYPQNRVTVFDIEGVCRLYTNITKPRLSGPLWFGRETFPLNEKK